MSILNEMLFDKVREEDNLVYSISSAKYFDEKINNHNISIIIKFLNNL